MQAGKPAPNASWGARGGFGGYRGSCRAPWFLTAAESKSPAQTPHKQQKNNHMCIVVWVWEAARCQFSSGMVMLPGEGMPLRATPLGKKKKKERFLGFCKGRAPCHGEGKVHLVHVLGSQLIFRTCQVEKWKPSNVFNHEMGNEGLHHWGPAQALWHPSSGCHQARTRTPNPAETHATSYTTKLTENHKKMRIFKYPITPMPKIP